jgi:uncharacterized membrane protein YeaQ/YmgE (transglycosylase-associated protein family)
MGVFSWIILGVIAGWLGGKLVHKTGQGLVMNIVLGIVGAMVGGYLATNLFGFDGVSGVNLWSILVATGGAVLTLVVYGALTGQRRG